MAQLPEAVDLVVVAVPARGVEAVARNCARKGIRALLVVSAGFEDGAAGAARRARLLALCRQTGMRLIGDKEQREGQPTEIAAGTFHGRFHDTTGERGLSIMNSEAQG